ncbi:hypothetical protein [Pseudomonas helleri]|uniref:hypothetical protein n=1 Tax=Pseudomonas helleri TaxID=1608996 RepID=UPI003FD31B49
MSNAKACLVFTRRLESKVPEICKNLVNEGFDVCTAVADPEVVEAAQLGSISVPEYVKVCILNSSICIFLIPEKNLNVCRRLPDTLGAQGRKLSLSLKT